MKVRTRKQNSYIGSESWNKKQNSYNGSEELEQILEHIYWF